MGGEVTRRGSRGELEQKLLSGLFVGVTGWGMIAQQEAKDRAPVDTGRLERSIQLLPAEEVRRLIVSITIIVQGVEYAAAQEFGSGLHDPDDPHTIEIWAGAYTGKSDKQALAFEWPGGPKDHPAYDPDSGKFLFAMVNHPGVPAQPYLRPGLEASREEGLPLLLTAVEQSLGIRPGGR